MRLLTRLLFTILIGAVLVTPAARARAQDGALALSAVAIELWPEYDHPSMLVQIFGTLDPRVALPAQVVVRLPAASEGPSAVATLTADGAWVNAPFSTAESGDQILVTLQADTADFRVEYYDPALVISGAARTYTFRWASDYAVAEVSVRVQAPVDSSQLTTEPELTPAGLGEDGLSYYAGTWGALAAGQEVRLQLSYSKSSAALSAEKITTSPPAATPVPAPGLNFSSPWLWGGVAGGLLVLGAAVWALWWLRSSPAEAPSPRSRRRRPVRASRPGRPGAAAPSEPASVGFCTQCGQRLQSGDRFCRSCGAPVRD